MSPGRMLHSVLICCNAMNMKRICTDHQAYILSLSQQAKHSSLMYIDFGDFPSLKLAREQV